MLVESVIAYGTHSQKSYDCSWRVDFPPKKKPTSMHYYIIVSEGSAVRPQTRPASVRLHTVLSAWTTVTNWAGRGFLRTFFVLILAKPWCRHRTAKPCRARSAPPRWKPAMPARSGGVPRLFTFKTVIYGHSPAFPSYAPLLPPPPPSRLLKPVFSSPLYARNVSFKRPFRTALHGAHWEGNLQINCGRNIVWALSAFGFWFAIAVHPNLLEKIKHPRDIEWTLVDLLRCEALFPKKSVNSSIPMFQLIIAKKKQTE